MLQACVSVPATALHFGEAVRGTQDSKHLQILRRLYVTVVGELQMKQAAAALRQEKLLEENEGLIQQLSRLQQMYDIASSPISTGHAVTTAALSPLAAARNLGIERYAAAESKRKLAAEAKRKVDAEAKLAQDLRRQVKDDARRKAAEATKLLAESKRKLDAETKRNLDQAKDDARRKAAEAAKLPQPNPKRKLEDDKNTIMLGLLNSQLDTGKEENRRLNDTVDEYRRRVESLEAKLEASNQKSSQQASGFEKNQTESSSRIAQLLREIDVVGDLQGVTPLPVHSRRRRSVR